MLCVLCILFVLPFMRKMRTVGPVVSCMLTTPCDLGSTCTRGNTKFKGRKKTSTFTQTCLARKRSLNNGCAVDGTHPRYYGGDPPNETSVLHIRPDTEAKNYSEKSWYPIQASQAKASTRDGSVKEEPLISFYCPARSPAKSFVSTPRLLASRNCRPSSAWVFTNAAGTTETSR